jgi:hypothetical protein
MDMNVLFNLMLILLALIFAISLTFGTNLKKWYGWAQVVCGFLLGVLVGSPQNIAGEIVTGFFFSIWVISLGPMVWKRRHS